jgi:ABC-type multidrug transport system ATPase subunit
VQQVCDEVGILHEGQFVFSGPAPHFNHNNMQYSLEVEDAILANQILQKSKNRQTEIREKEIWLTLESPDEVSEIIDLLRRNNVRIFQIKKAVENLESTYLKFVKK